MDTLYIHGGTLYDGTGAPPRQADLLVRGGAIEAVGSGLPAPQGAAKLDATGLVVTPGFVDMHRHCDIAPLRDADFGLLELAQGITTTLAGNCGLAPVPVPPERERECCDFIDPVVGPVCSGLAFATYAAYFAALESVPLPLNMGVLAGAGAIKTCLKGFCDAPYTAAELDAAAAYVAQAMAEGAFGVSLGIMYQPECYSTAEELARMVAPAAKAGGLLTTHIRGEGDSLVSSVREVIHIARLAGIRLHISHFKATGIHNWHDKIYRAIDEIDKARAEGLAVTADFYPYDGGATTLLSLVPPSVLDGGGEATLKRLAAPDGKALLRREINKTHPGWDNMALSIGWDRILISGTSLPQHAAYGGQSVAALAAQNGYEEPSDFVCDLLVQEAGRVGIIVLSMSQDDVDTVARLPYTAVISDALYGGGASPHPRLYGSFPKIIRDYVRARGVLTMEEAVHKMTGLPASIVKLPRRGLLKPGFAADINVFDPALLRDNAVYTDARRLATGMGTVLVNGVPVYQNGGLAPARPARVLRAQPS